METIKKNVLRVDPKRGEWCALEVELRTKEDGVKRLSICGSHGHIMPRKAAAKEHLESTAEWLEEPGELVAFNERNGTKFKGAMRAARYAISFDGDLNGDTREMAGGKNVMCLTSCGQIREELSEWFPEAVPFMKWHLNDMQAACEHQEALKWGRGMTIALAASTLTPAQREHYDAVADADVKKRREAEFSKRWSTLRASKNDVIAWLKSHGCAPTVDDVDTLMSSATLYLAHASMRLRAFERWLREDVERDVARIPFDAAIYKDSLGAPCPVCAYCYGTAWLTRELPPEVIAWVESLAATEGGV